MVKVSATGKVKPGVFKIPVMVETPYNILSTYVLVKREWKTVLTDSVSVVHEKSNVQMTEVMIWCDTPWVRLKPHHGSELILSQLVTWSLKFTLPAPSVAGATRQFSAVPRGYGPSGAQCLEGAVRCASPFSHLHEATTLLPNSDFLPARSCCTVRPSPGSNSRVVRSRVHPTVAPLWSSRPRAPQTIARWLFRPSLLDTFVASSRSNSVSEGNWSF